MNGKWAIPVLVSILILGSLGFSQQAFAAPGDFIVTDNFGNRLLKVTPAGVVTVIASSGLGTPMDVVIDSSGNYIVTDNVGNRLLKVTPAGVVTVIASTGLGTPLFLAIEQTPVGDPDTDGDGVPDSEDICPGFDDNIDTDGDGVPDGCDENPTLFCDSTTLQSGFACTANLNAICGEGTLISGLQCIGLAMQAVGGTLLQINTLAVLGAAIGVDPLITGLVVIIMLGVTGQVAWFVHRKKRNH